MRAEHIDAYIEMAPPASQGALRQLLAILRKTAPTAQECIRYGMPTFMDGGVLVHFAGYKNHVGFYPGASAIAAFKKEISSFQVGKRFGAIPSASPAAGRTHSRNREVSSSGKSRQGGSDTATSFFFATGLTLVRLGQRSKATVLLWRHCGHVAEVRNFVKAVGVDYPVLLGTQETARTAHPHASASSHFAICKGPLASLCVPQC